MCRTGDACEHSVWMTVLPRGEQGKGEQFRSCKSLVEQEPCALALGVQPGLLKGREVSIDTKGGQ
eukprot:14192799-Ditylum_brightwellii.AAC.1